ncbi:Histidine kinase [Rhodovastum atsumiense]|uniref:histidine kinase n=1 Tax=Rhodovastum atsumiense TaxID=504468 RepID=A0A5M6IIY6_9PROT|nr:ATP-binding protein [Rhodovastum atsumiense]KAA5608214.1 HAMP domain-containing protein [Rhodovastum atsumiense]CAH2602273.1 Histidine kinase [Rhodovastum atsumiense]
MKPRLWPRDTIALRFAVTIVLAIGVTLGCMGLFFIFGGEWAQPDPESLGIPKTVTTVARLTNAAPPELRPSLAAAASTDGLLQVEWYDAASPTGAALRDSAAHAIPSPRRLPPLDQAGPVMKLFLPEDPVATIPGLDKTRARYPQSYFLAIRLRDGSWVVFSAPTRIWGVSRQARWMIFGGICLLSIGVVSTLAARRLARPVRQLAEAVRTFGLNPQSPAIVESGPQEIRQVIETFNTMRAQIHSFVTHRTTMLAAISHDLRTPLTRMRLRGEFIEDPDQQARLFHDVDEMQAMIDGALAFFRDNAADEAPTTFDLPGVLQTIINDYADQGIELGYSGPPRGICRGRPFALKRAITNLVENAIKYATPPDIALSREDEALVIAVRDRGPGLPPDALTRVFDPYFRLDRSRNRATGGVGLGLTAAQAIIHEHGGKITLANRPGGGLEARIVLPKTGRPADPGRPG